MPHSSGGGSHGGGSHVGHSSHGSGTRKTQPPLRSDTYYPGYHRYVRYRNGRPETFYSKELINDKSRKRIKIKNICYIIFYTLCILFATAIFLFFSYHNPKKIQMDYVDQRAFIDDQLNILSDEEINEIQTQLKEFQDKTGITPCIIIGSNDLWKDNYANLEKYAYECYVNRFEDEKHWLLMYTQPVNPDKNFNDWYWEGMQGDDTDPIITTKVADNFNLIFHKKLLISEISVGEAFMGTFKELNSVVMNRGFDKESMKENLPFYAFAIIIFGLLIFSSVNILSENKMDVSAVEINRNIEYKEDKCEYCGGVFFHGVHIDCPHCGAKIPLLRDREQI